MRNLLLVAEDSLVRLGLRAAIAGHTIANVLEAAGPLDAVAKASHLQPDIILIDLKGVRLDEVQTIREIARAALRARIIVVTERDDDIFVEHAIMCGASAYLLKQTAATDLPWAIRAVQKGREYFAPVLVQRLRGSLALIAEPEQNLALAESSRSTTESLLVRMINQANLIRQLARELSANMRLIRQHQPHFLPRLGRQQRASAPGLQFSKRLFLRTFRRPGAAGGLA
jgi:DNA-binding NarL/FixJ family response regulator